MSALPQVCLIGYGEAGQALAPDLRAVGCAALAAWDVLFTDTASPPHRAAVAAGLHIGRDAAEVVADAGLVISAVTAAQSVAAARSASIALAPGAYFLDLNSVSPGTKTETAEIVANSGGRYVEAAVMSPIHPRRSASPMLFGGPHAEAFLPLARSLGFTAAEVYSPVVGRASAAKMCRSVMVKGIESLVTESMLAARRYGVEHTVLESLQDIFPLGDWRALSRYMISRSLQHGQRRSDEMREVAHTVAGAGLTPWMSSACMQRQAWTAAHAAALDTADLESMLDRMLADIPDPRGEPQR